MLRAAEAESALDKAPDAFRTISEVADDLDIPQHVLRFWETRFSQIKPMKRSGGRRYYRPDDVDLLRGIRRLLYGEGYTIRGVQRILREQGIKVVQGLADAAVPPPSLTKRSDQDDHDEDVTAAAEGAEVDTDEDGVEMAVAPRAGRAAAAARSEAERREPGGMIQAGPAGAGPAKGLSEAHAVRLRAALDDLIACKKLIDDALRAAPPPLTVGN
jgi:DNA-binding transcriptional MerR regulator